MVIPCGFLMTCVSCGRLVPAPLTNGPSWDVFNKEVPDAFRNLKKKKNEYHLLHEVLIILMKIS